MDGIQGIIIKIEELKQLKKFDDAVAIIQSSISKYSEDYRLYEELADIYLYRWEFDKALKAVNFSLCINPKSATGNYLKGFILLSKEKPHEAVHYLETSNKLIWNNSEVLRNLGWAYTLTEQEERWIAMLKRALNISPEDDLITEDLAMALIGSGEITEGNLLLKKIWKKSKI